MKGEMFDGLHGLCATLLHYWAMLNVCMLSSRDSSTRCALKCAVRLLRRRLTSVLGPRPPLCSTESFFLHHCKFHFPFRQDRIFLRNFLFLRASVPCQRFSRRFFNAPPSGPPVHGAHRWLPIHATWPHIAFAVLRRPFCRVMQRGEEIIEGEQKAAE